jgi:hypothetical protein
MHLSKETKDCGAERKISSAVMDIKNNGTGIVFTTLHFLHNLRVGPMEENQLQTEH